MDIALSKEDPAKLKADVLIYATTEDELKVVDTRFEKVLSNVVGSGDFTGEFGKLHMLYPKGIIGSERLLLLGLGKQKELDLERIRRAFATAVQSLSGFSVKSIAVHYLRPRGSEIVDSDIITCILEGLMLGNYRFSKYMTELKEKVKIDLHKVIIVGRAWKNIHQLEEVAEQVGIVCENVNFTRDLVNESGNITHPGMLENLTKHFASKHGFKLKVLHKDELTKLGLNLLLAVGRGSVYEPRLIIIEYNGDPKSREKIALVGKGITFDSGGLNLKPSGHIETMRLDMAGAATCLGVLRTAEQLRLRKNLVAILPTCENMIGPDAYKPGDIIKSYSGKTVEIANTDAEGRLVLADAITYAKKYYGPKIILDYATLTGSVVGTFGTFVTGLFTNDETLAEKIFSSGQRTFERVWRLPLYEEYREEIKSDIADLKNCTEDRYAGAITAAAFLEAFVDKTRWAHFDIAGSAWFEKQKFYIPKGGTGAGVRLTIELLKNL